MGGIRNLARGQRALPCYRKCAPESPPSFSAFPRRQATAIPSNSARVSAESVNCPVAKFSRRCPTDDVPGISRDVGRPVQQPR